MPSDQLSVLYKTTHLPFDKTQTVSSKRVFQSNLQWNGEAAKLNAHKNTQREVPYHDSRSPSSLHKQRSLHRPAFTTSRNSYWLCVSTLIPFASSWKTLRTSKN